jgi:hypothetical protein
MAHLWHRLPSEVLHIADPYTAWCFDEAVFTFYLLQQQAQQGEPEGTVSASDIMAMRGVGGIDINME